MRYEDEHFALAGEILQEAMLETMKELLRRRVPANIATGVTIITMFTVATTLAHNFFTKTGNKAVSKEDIHRRVDEMWETLSGPTKKTRKH